MSIIKRMMGVFILAEMLAGIICLFINKNADFLEVSIIINLVMFGILFEKYVWKKHNVSYKIAKKLKQ